MLCDNADGLGEGIIKAELELLSWKKVVDVTKDGGVIKRVLKDSSDYKTATAESTVKVRLVCSVGDTEDMRLCRNQCTTKPVRDRSSWANDSLHKLVACLQSQPLVKQPASMSQITQHGQHHNCLVC